MKTETVRFIFYVDTPTKRRKYLVSEGKWGLFDEAHRFPYFKEGLELVIKLVLPAGYKPGYVKVSEVLEYREVKL